MFIFPSILLLRRISLQWMVRGWDFQTRGDGGEPLWGNITPVSILSKQNKKPIFRFFGFVSGSFLSLILVCVLSNNSPDMYICIGVYIYVHCLCFQKLAQEFYFFKKVPKLQSPVCILSNNTYISIWINVCSLFIGPNIARVRDCPDITIWLSLVILSFFGVSWHLWIKFEKIERENM